jgi:hypothetical protein
MNHARSFALSLFVTGSAALSVGCTSEPTETADEDVSETEEALTGCTATPANATEAKYRVAGFIVGDGVATTKGTYHYRFPRESFKTYFVGLLKQAGLQYTLASDSVDIPRTELWPLRVALQGTKYPYSTLPELEDAPTTPPYSATSPGCRIRHFTAAILQVDGAAQTGEKTQQVTDDPYARKREEFKLLWQRLGAKSAYIDGNSVMIARTDNPVAQCLPNLYFGRVPGGEPAPGTCP